MSEATTAFEDDLSPITDKYATKEMHRLHSETAADATHDSSIKSSDPQKSPNAIGTTTRSGLLSKASAVAHSRDNPHSRGDQLLQHLPRAFRSQQSRSLLHNHRNFFRVFKSGSTRAKSDKGHLDNFGSIASIATSSSILPIRCKERLSAAVHCVILIKRLLKAF